jgi:hypothetical protein
VAAASGACGCATETWGPGSGSLDLESEDVLCWIVESFGIADAASSIGAMIWGAVFDPDAIPWAFGSDDMSACCEAAVSEVGELVSSVVAPTVSAPGAAEVAAILVSGDGVT